MTDHETIAAALAYAALALVGPFVLTRLMQWAESQDAANLILEIGAAIEGMFVGRHVTTDSDVDAMLDLADSVMLHVRAHDFGSTVIWPAGVTSPQTVGIDLNPDDALTERNVWRAVITATYRVFESNVLPTV
ncbi:MAG: hypothetical protein EBR82_25160 [Caulobacteraceae bacterium]|nr:hypothetical protein [Caulobacteraceae bacterium]